MSSPPVSPRAALLLLLLLMPLLAHTFAQPSPAGLLEEVAGDGGARHGMTSGHGPAAAARARSRDARLPLPTPQEIDAIRKVAQILAMLGEQVIPALVGPPAPAPAPAVGAIDAPADALDDD